MTPPAPATVIVACGALAHEVRDLLARHSLGIDYVCLPAGLHNTPEKIPDALRAKLTELTDTYERIVVGYADCGTAGGIDEVCAEFASELTIERLVGPHCYATYAGQDRFEAMHEEEFGSFYLTDFLARNFDVMVWKSLGLDRYPQLLESYFGHYRRVVFLDQTGNPETLAAAQRAADRMGLDFVHEPTGYGELEEVLVALRARPTAPTPAHASTVGTAPTSATGTTPATVTTSTVGTAPTSATGTTPAAVTTSTVGTVPAPISTTGAVT